MADPTLVLLIVIGTSPAARPHGSTVSAAVVDALGRDARVLVEERPDDPSDAEAAALADAVRGSAVAEIAWGDEAHSRVRLHVYLAADRTWYDREVTFEPADAVDERERAIGFLVGVMIRETEGVALTLPARPPPIVSQPAPAAATSAAGVPPKPPVGDAPKRFGVDVAGVMATGIEGDAAALGPSLRGRLLATVALSFDAGASIGFGSIDAAEATMTTTRIVVGGRWRWLTIGRDLAFDLGLEALAVHHAVRRADPAADRDRWLGGAHADLGAGWSVSELLEPFVTAGVDAVAGNTPIHVASVRLAHVPPFRAILELGVRMRF